MLKFFGYLGKVPFIGTVVGFFTGKARLILEYVLIGLVIAAGATVVTLWYRANYLELKNDELRERVVETEQINQRQDETITHLQQLREVDGLVIAGLVADYSRLSEADTKARKKLATLEKENAPVREYLNRPLPPELSCLLNNTCKAGNSDGGSKGTPPAPTAGAVSKARASSAAD